MQITVTRDLLKMTDAEAGVWIKAAIRECEPSNQVAVDVLAYLNEKTGRSYRAVPGNLGFIKARIEDCGGDTAPLIQVIDDRVKAWGDSPRWAVYLRPATLFNRTKFEQYLGALGVQKNQADIISDWATRGEGAIYEPE